MARLFAQVATASPLAVSDTRRLTSGGRRPRALATELGAAAARTPPTVHVGPYSNGRERGGVRHKTVADHPATATTRVAPDKRSLWPLVVRVAKEDASTSDEELTRVWNYVNENNIGWSNIMEVCKDIKFAAAEMKCSVNTVLSVRRGVGCVTKELEGHRGTLLGGGKLVMRRMFGAGQRCPRLVLTYLARVEPRTGNQPATLVGLHETVAPAHPQASAGPDPVSSVAYVPAAVHEASDTEEESDTDAHIMSVQVGCDGQLYSEEATQGSQAPASPAPASDHESADPEPSHDGGGADHDGGGADHDGASHVSTATPRAELELARADGGDGAAPRTPETATAARAATAAGACAVGPVRAPHARTVEPGATGRSAAQGSSAPGRNSPDSAAEAVDHGGSLVGACHATAACAPTLRLAVRTLPLKRGRTWHSADTNLRAVKPRDSGDTALWSVRPCLHAAALGFDGSTSRTLRRGRRSVPTLARRETEAATAVLLGVRGTSVLSEARSPRRTATGCDGATAPRAFGVCGRTIGTTTLVPLGVIAEHRKRRARLALVRPSVGDTRTNCQRRPGDVDTSNLERLALQLRASQATAPADSENSDSE